MKFLFVRHGETDSNKTWVLMGQGVDESLNEEGIKQVEDLALKLNDDFDMIFSSSLKRALETANILNNRFGKPLEIKEELRERHFGSLSGKSWEEVGMLTGEDIEDMKKRDLSQAYDYRRYGGESTSDVTVRLEKFINSVRSKPYKKILVVTHGGIIRLAYKVFKNEGIVGITNTSIHEFEF